MKIEFFDTGREAREKPNRDYPLGIDLDASGGALATCKVPLPWPAKRIGQWHITCDACHTKVLVTTAGRLDDPRSVKIACLFGQARKH